MNLLSSRPRGGALKITVPVRHQEASPEDLTILLELLASVPQPIVCCGTDGEIIRANPAATAALGPDVAVTGRWPLTPERAVHEDGTPFRPDELPVQAALRSGEVVADVMVGVPDAQTAVIRWLRVTAVPAIRDARGRPRTVFAVFTDVTEQRRMEAALRENTGLLTHLRDANVLGVIASTEEAAYDANDAFLELIGRTRADLAAGRISCQKITPPEWAALDRAAEAQLRSAGAFQPYEKEYVHQDGHRVPVMVGGAAVSRHPLRWATFVVDLTARQRAEREQAELQERERAARAQAEYAGERLSFLLRAGSMAAASRDPQEMLEHAAGLVVPALADHCMVMLPAQDGLLQATSLAHRDPARAPVLAEFGLRRIPVAGPMATQKAYQTGTSQLAQDVNAKLPQWHSLAPGLIEILARLRAESVLATPIMIGDRAAGVLTLARDADRPPFAPADVEVMEEFARRLSAGLVIADTFAREHTIAETLQRSLLPDGSPQIGLDLAVRYLPASDGVHVGGDWYDAFPLPGSGIGLVIGDVAGHDLTSAAVMGQVRSLLRAYALDHPDPAEVLRRTGEALLRLLPDALASAVYAVLDPATGELRYASAGHPPPLATDGNGTFCYLDDAPGTMLGAGPGVPQRTARRRLPPGGGLLLYTDGLIEGRHRDLGEGLAALAAALAAARPATAGEACQAAERLLAGPQSRADDVCLLAVRLPRSRD